MIKKQVVKVEKDYRCPFCPDHEDCYYVIWEGLMETPICDACDWELKYYFLSPPREAIYFGSDALPMQERIPILEKITGKSILDLQMSFVLGELAKCCDPKYFDEIMRKHTDIWGGDLVKHDIKKERRKWIEHIRYTKKLIRQIMRMRKRTQTANK